MPVLARKKDYITCDNVNVFTDDVNYSPDNVLNRCTTDTVSNSHGLKLIDLCISTSIRIANGRLHNDKTGACTFFNFNGSSLIDYLLLSEQAFKLISKFNIDPLCEWSDHCSLSICLSLTDCLHSYNIPDTSERFKVSWSYENRVAFRRL